MTRHSRAALDRRLAEAEAKLATRLALRFGRAADELTRAEPPEVAGAIAERLRPIYADALAVVESGDNEPATLDVVHGWQQRIVGAIALTRPDIAERLAIQFDIKDRP
jgi:hypothetical protein